MEDTMRRSDFEHWGRYILVMVVLSICSACGSSTPTGNGSLVGPLIMQIDWTPMDAMDANMDIGATTPQVDANGDFLFIAAGFVTAVGCTHSGDTGFSGGAGPFRMYR